MKTLLTFLAIATTSFAQTLTKDYQVIEKLTHGVIVQEIVMKSPQQFSPPKHIPETSYSQRLHTYRDGTSVWLSPNYANGGNASAYKPRPVLDNTQYFIPRDNSNSFFQKDHKFKATTKYVNTVKRYGQDIKVLKGVSYSTYVDPTLKKPAPVPSKLVQSGSKFSRVKQSPRN